MAIIQFIDKENRKKGERHLRAVTTCHARAEPVYFVPIETLVELDSYNVKYKELKESDLPNVLSEKGLKYYTRCKRFHPECLFFETKLPPKGYLHIHFYVEKEKFDAANDLLKDFEPLEVKNNPAISVILGCDDDLEERIMIECYLKRDRYEELLKSLSRAGIAGYDRAHMVFRRDTDRA